MHQKMLQNISHQIRQHKASLQTNQSTNYSKMAFKFHWHSQFQTKRMQTRSYHNFRSNLRLFGKKMREKGKKRRLRLLRFFIWKEWISIVRAIQKVQNDGKKSWKVGPLQFSHETIRTRIGKSTHLLHRMSLQRKKQQSRWAMEQESNAEVNDVASYWSIST